MRHTETVRLTGKSVTIAVAAALFAMAGSANAATDYSRITTSIDDPTIDAAVTYEDITSDIDARTTPANLDFQYVPVQPAENTPMTLNLNSLTVDNQTTEGSVTVITQKVIPGDPVTYEDVRTQYTKNGGGIATNTGSGITLTTAKDLSVTARTTAIEASGGSSITGTIGGNFTVSSQDVGISAAEAAAGDGLKQAANFTLSGGTAEISAVNDAIHISGLQSSASVKGASSIVIKSDSGSALSLAGGGQFQLDTAKEGDDYTGSILLQSGGSVGTLNMTSTGSNLGNAYTYITGDTVKIQNIGTGSAVVNNVENRQLVLSAYAESGNGIEIKNNSAANATVLSGPDTATQDGNTAVQLSTSGSAIVITNEDPNGLAVLAERYGAFIAQMTPTAAPMQITGNLKATDHSQLSIYPTGGFIKADTISLDKTAHSDIELKGDAVLSSRSGGKTEVTGTNSSTLVGLMALENSTINANVTLSSGATGGFYAMNNGTWNGDILLTGDESDGWYQTTIATTYVQDNGVLNGNLSSEKGAQYTVGVMGKGRINGNFKSDGLSELVQEKATADVDVTQYHATLNLMIAEEGAVTGNASASNYGAMNVYLSGEDAAYTGDMTSASNGVITMMSQGTWTGSSSVSGGTTDVTMNGAAAVWNVTGNSEITNFTQDAGTVNYPAAASGFTGTTVTVDGNYSSNGGAINMSTVLQGDTSAHDELDIKGDATGTATITFTKASGTGSKTIEGIKVVQVDGASDAVFTKPDSNRLTAGAYIYDLKKVGKDWYLTSQRDPNVPVPVLPKTDDDPDPTPDTPEQPDILPPADPTDPTAHIVKPELGSYAANLLASNTLFNMTLNDRLGETRYSDALKDQKHSGNIWIRTAGGKTHSKMFDDQLTNRGDWGLVQVGGDVVSWAGSGDHRFHAGLMMGYAHQSEKTRSSEVGVTSKGKVSGYSAGLYATYMNAAPAGTGPYVDTWLMWQKFKNKVDPSNSVEESYDSKGFTGSIEAGYTFGLKDWVSADGTVNATRLQLQAQVIRMGVRADQHVDAENFTVAGTGAGNVRSRVGATVYHLFTNEKTGRVVKPFIGLNWYHDTKSFGVVYDGIKDRIEGNRNFGEVKLGVEGKVTKHVNLWGAAAYQQGSHSFRNLGAFIGAKVLF